LKTLDPWCDTPAGAVEGALGIYEVQLLENGNLKFTEIEDDECQTRAGALQGRTIAAEWEPVP